MQKIKVLIADDSVIYRSEIRAALEAIAGVEVVGVASNGALALERMSQNVVDLLVLDLEMPGLDGISTLSELSKRGFTGKVLVFSSASTRGAEITLEALRRGASDFVPKPGVAEAANSPSSAPREKIRALLEPKILGLFPDLLPPVAVPPQASANEVYPSLIWDLFSPKIIVIGSTAVRLNSVFDVN